MKKISVEEEKFMKVEEVIGTIMDGLRTEDIVNKKILFICEDYTRSVPVHLFFGTLVQKLASPAKLTVLFALGTHRPMERGEMLAKLGIDELFVEKNKIALVNHSLSEENLEEIGEIDGISLKLNRAMGNQDTVITLGGVLPHRVVGFSGGAKILCPGIANKEMVDYSHWLSTTFPEAEIMAKIENPMRDLFDKISDLVEVYYDKTSFYTICFVVIDGKGVVDVSVGGFKDAYRRAAEVSKRVFIKKVKRCDSVLVMIDDKCTDFWQAAKAVYNCARILNTGGKIVVFGKLSEGISASHHLDIEKIGYSTPDIVRDKFACGEIDNQVAASHMIRVSEHLERVKIYLSSPNISETECNKVNLGYMDPVTVREKDFDYVVYNPVDLVLDVVK